MRPIVLAGMLLSLAGTVSTARAGEFWQPAAPCYWCVRDAIYDDARFIAHREANPDIDESVKGPEITAARANVHRLRGMLGPPVPSGAAPCCYTREPLHIH